MKSMRLAVLAAAFLAVSSVLAQVPPDADQAKDALAKSPRHGEWVDVALPGGGKVITWVVYPEKKEKTGVVLVIHEIFGLSDWVRGVADQLAKEGFIALAPDLLSGMGPNGGGTDSLGADATKVIRTTPADAAAANAVRATRSLPAANGKVGSVGYCWGGTTSFAPRSPSRSSRRRRLMRRPESPDTTRRSARPSWASGGDDARVDATIRAPKR